jgi:hypothetical protein
MNLFKNQSGCVDTAGYRVQKKKNQWYSKKDTPPSPKEEGLEKT